jgi:hypothetical protein
LQDFARHLAKEKIASSKERKQFLYSIMKNTEIKNAIAVGNLEIAKETTKRLIKDWLEIEDE